MPTLEPVQAPLLQFGDGNGDLPPKPGSRGMSGDRPNVTKVQELPEPLIDGDFAVCQFQHRADGKICGDRLSLIDERGFTDWRETIDHLRSDAHRVELMLALGYAMRTARQHEPRNGAATALAKKGESNG